VRRLAYLVLGLLSLGGSPAIHAQVTLIGTATIPSDAADLSGLKGSLADGSPLNRLGSQGSAIDYSGRGNLYVMASDRGPLDGATDFPVRLHFVSIVVNPNARPPVAVTLDSTVLLRNGQGENFVGSNAALNLVEPSCSLRLDPEGVRFGPQGTLFVADEYGPSIHEFTAKGQWLRSLPVPQRFRPAAPSVMPEEELPPRNRAGRQPNRGFEGLAITPRGDKLVAILQSPLIQDGALDGNNKRIGCNIRMLEIDVAKGTSRELVYPLESPNNGVNEILALDDHNLLVLERDGKSGKAAQFKKLFRIDLRQATDISTIEQLPAADLPPGVRPVKKSEFLDFLDPKWGLDASQTPEKHEGLALGPPLPDGRRLLLVSVDNDFLPNVPTTIYAFACPAK